MNTQSDTRNDLSRVLQKICEIAEKSADGDYIFRGETRAYAEVMSALYRKSAYDIEAGDLDIGCVQEEILNSARKYTEKTDELDILIELLYHGVATNLIEFTTDFHIALFFACDGSPSEDGKVILEKRDSVARYLKQPHEPKKRMIVQKTVFIQPPKGFVNPDEVIIIPADLKLPMLAHLRKSHGISTETIHNDLHGFIRHWSIHENAYTQFHRGTTYRKRADSVQNWDEKLKWFERAIVHYTQALELKPDFPEAYNNRGAVYANAGDYDRAIQDHNTAITLKSDDASAYNNRGIVYHRKGDYDRAILDYHKAIELKSDFLEAYNNRAIAYFSEGDLDRAINDFNTVIKLDPNDAKAYTNLGTAYFHKRDFDRAIQNHNMAIELDPGFAGFYSNRGEAWLPLKQWEKARADLTFAKENGYDIIGSFHNDYESVEDFEQKNDVQLPENIAAMLRQQ